MLSDAAPGPIPPMTDQAWQGLLGDQVSALAGIVIEISHELSAGGATDAQRFELEQMRADVNALLDRWRERWKTNP